MNTVCFSPPPNWQSECLHAFHLLHLPPFVYLVATVLFFVTAAAAAVVTGGLLFHELDCLVIHFIHLQAEASGFANLEGTAPHALTYVSSIGIHLEVKTDKAGHIYIIQSEELCLESSQISSLQNSSCASGWQSLAGCHVWLHNRFYNRYVIGHPAETPRKGTNCMITIARTDFSPCWQCRPHFPATLEYCYHSHVKKQTPGEHFIWQD